jgi:hypothetical protein
LRDLHKNTKLFHGDIKPMNIFYSAHECNVTSDSGSVVPLFEENDWFSPRTFTPGFATLDYA